MVKRNKFVVGLLLFLNLDLFVEVGSNINFSYVKGALENNVVYHFENAASLRPVANLADLINVTLDLNIAAVNDFNEQNGYIEISGYLNMDWTPTEGTPETSDFEEFVGNSLIWKPPIILVNAVNKAEVVGWDSNVAIRYNFNTLRCSWRPWVITRSACTPDVKYYPFDKQDCSFKFVAWGYNSSEMLITATSPSLTFNFFEENGEWVTGDTSASSYIENKASVVEYKLGLTRRPTYYVINLIAPIILLSALNAFVFILPPDSGERIGYSITCFLSYVVLLNTVMAFLPSSAAPMAYLSYYTFVMMVFSAGMSLATIITLRIHFKPPDEPVSPGLRAFWACVCCKWCSVTEPERTTKVEPVVEMSVVTEVTMISWDDPDDTDDVQSVSRDSTLTDDTDRSEAVSDVGDNADNDAEARDGEEFTWKKVAFYLDVIFFLGFLSGQIFYSVAYLVPIIVN